MKKVLQISKYMYPFLGGTEQVARDMAHVFAEMGMEQKIICFNEDAQDETHICHRKETVHDTVDNVEVIRCGYVMKLASQSLSVTYARELRKVMDEFRPDIVILHYPNPFVSHFLLKYKKRAFKLVLYWHLDITKQKFLRKFFHRQNLALIERADKILGATPKHIEESAYTNYFKKKKEILPYTIQEKHLMISQKEIEKAEEIRKKYKNKILGFFIGRHVEYKGLRYLIDASKRLGVCDLHFLIAGIGELTQELQKQAQGDNKVEFLGKISDSERKSYFYACDIICFPSVTRNEGFGLALAEGMYFGKPAVTFTIPGSGVNYVNINGVTGIECPNGNSRAYAEALKKLVQEPNLRKQYGDAARRRVQENFTIDKFYKNVKTLVDSL